MSKIKIRKPHCSDCEKYLVYNERYSKRQHGAMMNPGEQFCLGEKKARRFKQRDSKTGIPIWCPKKIFPRIVRIYGFKDVFDEMLCIRLSNDIENYIPSEHNYMLRESGTTELTAVEYYEAGLYQDELTPKPREIVEIDAGVSSNFFYHDGNELKYLPFFDKSRISKE